MRTRHITASVLPAGLAAASLAGCAADQNPGSQETHVAPSSTTRRLDPAVNAALDALIDSGATATVIDIRDGDERLGGAAGSVSHDDSTAADPDDQLRIASVTKSMTATIIMQFVESGELRLDTVLDEVLPGLLQAPAPVTVAQLLNHTSGLPDYFDVVVPDPAAYAAATDNRLHGPGSHRRRADTTLGRASQ